MDLVAVFRYDLVLMKAGPSQVTSIVRECQLRLYGHVARPPRRIPPIGFFSVEIRGLDHAEGASTRFMVALGEVLYLRDMGIAGLRLSGR